jgi:hypothetical protein
MHTARHLKDLLRGIEGALKPRRLSRQPVSIPLSVETADESITGDGRDLTEHGLRVRLPHTLPPGRHVVVDLTPPGFADSLRFPARVKWTRVDGDDHLAGLEFDARGGPREKLKLLLLALAEGLLPELKRSGRTTRRRTV